MTSPRKLNANQSNAQKSTGAKTTAGRVRVARNALKAGLYAKVALLPSEDARSYGALRESILDDYRPRGAVEEVLAELIIADLWRIDRFVRIENAFLRQTESARSRESWGRIPVDIECFLNDLRRGSASVQMKTGLPGSAMRLVDHLGDGQRAVDDSTSLLDAHISPASQYPMEDIARQRRQTTRELLRNIAALEAKQACLLPSNRGARFNGTFEARG
jgi:hypothetical protein